jgi:hypothetical protein
MRVACAGAIPAILRAILWVNDSAKSLITWNSTLPLPLPENA